MSSPLSSTKSASPHPVLQAVLGNLDVQLEVELALYRCHQAVRRLPPLARQTSQAQISQVSNQNLLKKTELAATQLPENSDLDVDNSFSSDFSNSSLAAVARDQAASSIEQTAPLTLEAYLEFSKAHLQKPEKAPEKSRFLQILKPLGIAAVSLLLSIPLSYLVISLMINYSTGLNGVSSDCPATEAPKHFCNSSSVSDR